MFMMLFISVSSLSLKASCAADQLCSAGKSRLMVCREHPAPDMYAMFDNVCNGNTSLREDNLHG